MLYPKFPLSLPQSVTWSLLQWCNLSISFISNLPLSYYLWCCIITSMLCTLIFFLLAVLDSTCIYNLMCCPTFLLAAWNTEAIVCPDKVIQLAISLLHQWQGGATRNSLSGFVLVGVVVKDLQLNESGIRHRMTSPAAIHHLVCPQPFLYLSSIQQRWFRVHIHDRGTNATI